MKKTLVLGASTNPSRYSNIAIHRLIRAGEEVVAVGLREGVVNGITITSEMEPFDDIDTVTLYVGPKNQPVYYDYIISLRPRRVIFNPGTENPELFQLLNENGISYEAACTLVLLGTDQY